MSRTTRLDVDGLDCVRVFGKWILPCDEWCWFESIDGRCKHVTSRKLCALPARGIIWIQHAARRAPTTTIRTFCMTSGNTLKPSCGSLDRLIAHCCPVTLWSRRFQVLIARRGRCCSCPKCVRRCVCIEAETNFVVGTYLSVDDFFRLECKHVGERRVVYIRNQKL